MKSPAYRMRDLVAESGLPASALRYYVREGVLPPPDRTAVNAALYGDQHLVAARALGRFHKQHARLPLAMLRRAIALVLQGVDPDIALALEGSVMARGFSGEGNPMPLAAAAKAAGLAPSVFELLCGIGVLVPLQADGQETFDTLDCRIAQMAAPLLAADRSAASEARKISRLISEASRREILLRNRLTLSMKSAAAAQLSMQMQEFANIWHAYLFSRLRMRDVARHGLGNRPATGKRKVK